MKVSVIVPIHNSESSLKKCLDSIVNQTLKDIEIILINNASTDNSEEICLRYTTDDNRIKYINLDTPGVSNARNVGKNMATGEYIAFVDSDDYVASNMYELLYDKAISDDTDVVMCGFNKVINGIIKPSGESNLIEFAENKQYYRFWYGNIVMGSTCRAIYKRELAQSIDFDTQIRYTEDLIFSVEILDKAKRITAIEDRLYNYVIETHVYKKYRNESIWNDIIKANERETIVLEKNGLTDLIAYSRFSSYVSIYDMVFASDEYDSKLVKIYKRNKLIIDLNTKLNYRAYCKNCDGKKARIKAFLYRYRLYRLAYLMICFNRKRRSR